MSYFLNVMRPHHPGVLNGHIHEHAVQVQVLLRMGIDQVVKMMAGDGQHRLAVHLCVIKTVEQMDAAWPRSGQTDTQPARIFGVSAGHEGGSFLVPHLEETNFVLALAQGLHQSVYPIAWKPENDLHSPINESFNEHVCCSSGHAFSFFEIPNSGSIPGFTATILLRR